MGKKPPQPPPDPDDADDDQPRSRWGVIGEGMSTVAEIISSILKLFTS